ncbi:MAG: chromate transporter [Candidatus Eremiobacteraeota bacterium]|nr:chromate transporter [Candidatus Eremiobacteraeota bacterium]
MSDAPAAVAGAHPSVKPSLGETFVTFLIIGATSFGGGVVAYLRNSLVKQKRWFSDAEFLEIVSISNTLPGLNATNVAILAGDRLRGAAGATAAVTAMCLPAFVFMTVAGIIYGETGGRPLTSAILRGVAAAAVGLLAATWYQIGKKSVKGFYDVLIILMATFAISHYHLSVPIVLLAVGALSIFIHRPRPPAAAPEEEQTWIKSLQ